MVLMLSHRRMAAALCAAAVMFVPAACSSDASDKSKPSSTAASTDTTDSSGGTGGSTNTTPAVDTLFGYRVEGDSGTMTLKAELVAEGDLGAQQPTEGKWELNGTPRSQLFTTWIESGKVTFTLEGGDGATVSIIRGTQSDPDDPTSEIDVDSTVVKKDLAAGDSVTLEFP